MLDFLSFMTYYTLSIRFMSLSNIALIQYAFLSFFFSHFTAIQTEPINMLEHRELTFGLYVQRYY